MASRECQNWAETLGMNKRRNWVSIITIITIITLIWAYIMPSQVVGVRVVSSWGMEVGEIRHQLLQEWIVCMDSSCVWRRMWASQINYSQRNRKRRISSSSLFMGFIRHRDLIQIHHTSHIITKSSHHLLELKVIRKTRILCADREVVLSQTWTTSVSCSPP